MANENINITLTIDDKGTIKIKNANSEIKKLGDESKSASQKMQQSWTEINQMFTLVEGKLKQVYQAFKKAYEFAREGAELEFTINKFDRLSEAIDTTSTALLEDLKKATDGTMSDMDLMASATDFMTLGLAKSHDEVVRLSAVSSQLGMDMNQLVLTLTNRTTMRFDALGVAVDGFDEKVKALEKSGLSVEDAFTEAFLQQAEDQIAKVGSVTDETLGSFMRFEAAIENLAVTMKTKAAPASEDLINTLADGINVLGGRSGWEYVLEKVNDQVGKSITTYDQYRTAVNGVLEEYGLLIDSTGELTITTFEGSVKFMAAKDNLELLSDSMVESSKYTKGWTEEMYKAYHGINDVDKASQTLIDTQTKLKDATNNANAAMRTYNEALLFSIASQGLNEYQALQLAYAMGLVDEKTVYATQKATEYKTMLDEGVITLAEFNKKLVELNSALEGTPRDLYIDIWLETHGLEGIQQISNMGGGGSSEGGFNLRAAGGDVRPGGSYIVGEHGIELLQMGYNGQGQITPMSNITNNYNLGVTTTQSLNTVTTGFAILQAMG